MALRVCIGAAGCGTKYAVGLPRCPQCLNTESREDGELMPKITRHGGASIAGAAVVGGAWSDTDSADDWPDVPPATASQDEGGEQPSPGNSSSASPEKPDSTPKKSAPGRPKRARTTGSRSKPAPTGGSSAPSTDGGPTDPGSAADSDA
jgi:hypothetical protein